MRRAKTHHRRENQIRAFSLAQRFGFGRGKHRIARLKSRAEKIQRFKEWLGGIERLGDLSWCHQSGATGVVATTLTRMRIVRGLLGIMRMVRFAVRVFRSFRCLGVVALVMSECPGSVCFRMVMIVGEQMLNAAKRGRQQPKHDTASRNDAEGGRNLLLAVGHALSPTL